MGERNREILFEGWLYDSRIRVIKTFNTIRDGEGNKNRYYLTKKRPGKHNIKLKINRTIVDELLDNNNILLESFKILGNGYGGKNCSIGPITEHIEDPR
jgi:hypothetical protein